MARNFKLFFAKVVRNALSKSIFYSLKNISFPLEKKYTFLIVIHFNYNNNKKKKWDSINDAMTYTRVKILFYILIN